jgi:hypothetical protein
MGVSRASERRAHLAPTMLVLLCTGLATAAAPPPAPTVVSIEGTGWRINGKPTHEGSQVLRFQ